MNNYPQYTGSKFRYMGSRMVYNQYGDLVEKKDFVPTRGYMNYLKAKDLETTRRNLQKMYHKLQYQMETYGEVDNIDYNEFMYELKRSGLSLKDLAGSVR